MAGAGSRTLAMVASLFALVIAYGIIRVAAAGLPGAAAATSAWPPADPAPSLRRASRLALHPSRGFSPALTEIAQAGLRSAPLAYEPFIIAAKAEERAGRLGRAVQLLEQARRRRPTSTAVRAQLVSYYTRTRRYDDALVEIDLLMRRNEGLRNRFMPELAKLMATPWGRVALASVLAREPEWRPAFYTVAASAAPDPRQARDLVRRISLAKRGGDLQLERQFMLQSLAAAGRYAEARREWLAGLSPAARAKSAYLSDGDFTGAAGPQPFDWKLYDLDVGHAEMTRDGDRPYLDVAYFGGRDAVLGEQLLALAPGRYTLRIAATADSAVPPDRLAWRIDCLRQPSELVVVDLAGIGRGRLAEHFAVPADCPGQKLSLIGKAGEAGGIVNVRVAQLEIAR